jgi:hypothetical protein
MARSTMKRITAKTQQTNEEYAHAWRSFLKGLLRAKVPTKKQKEELARKMNVSVHYVNTMMYRGEGGMDAWTAALSLAYNLDLPRFFDIVQSALNKSGTETKSDLVWQQLDKIVNENEKFYWISLLHALIIADK